MIRDLRARAAHLYQHPEDATPDDVQMLLRNMPFIGEVVALQTVPGEEGSYDTAEMVLVTLELPISAAEMFPIGRFVACTAVGAEP